MLDILRQGARSWGIKIMFAMIIAVFVLAFGIGRLDRGHRGAVALVDGEAILLTDYQRAVQTTLERLRAENPSLSPEVLDALDVRGQVFRQMVGSTLLLQEARRLGLFVTDAELAQAVHAIPAFQENGRFSPERYRRALAAQGLEPARFEEDFRKDLLVDKLRQAIGQAARIPEAQAQDLAAVLGRTADLALYVFAADAERVTVAEADIAAYHAAHPEEFQEPARARVRLVQLTSSALAKPEAVEPAAVQAAYDAQPDRFREPEAVRARHILRLLPPGANATEEERVRAELEAMRGRIRDAASFAAEAAAHSQDASASRGGDLGWFERGRMVPEFEEAAFALPVGQVSEIVRTPFGLHLILVEEKRPARRKTLEEAAPAIRAQIAQDRAAERLGDALDTALEAIARGKDLAEVAQGLGLPVLEPAPFTEAEGPMGFALKPEDRKALMLLAPGTTTQAPILLPDGYLLAAKVEDIPARTRSLDETRDDIRARLTRQRQEEAAKAKAEAAKAALPAAPQGARLQQAAGVGRQGQVPGLGSSAELGAAILRQAEAGGWLPEIYRVGDAWVLARVEALHEPDPANWASAKAGWVDSLRQQAAEQLFQAYLQGLWEKAKLEILVPELLQPASKS